MDFRETDNPRPIEPHCDGDLYKPVWKLDLTGDWSEDNRIGRENAARFIKFMRRRRAVSHLGGLVHKLVRMGRYGGAEIGFFHALAERLLK